MERYELETEYITNEKAYERFLNNKAEYENEPVYYCKDCLSLKIKFIAGLDNSEYCCDCNSTNIVKGTFKEWDELYRERFHHSYIEEFNSKNIKK